jgi:serine/threonine protein kinase
MNKLVDGGKLGGRYQIISHLGGGGFGQTYLAQDTHLPGNPSCVVKHLKPLLTDSLSLETAKRLFETEAQVLYKLGDYSQIPRLFAHFEENQEFYLVQEFIDGDNLGKELIPGIRLAESLAIVLLQDILEVLIPVHQQNAIHRDLKPSNLIRRRRDGRIVLIDFGAVKQLSTQVIQVHSHTTRTIAIGSPGYMPSEQMAGRPRFCSDLYAVGMIGIQALTGAHPRELPEDIRTSEMIWRDRAQVSSELADILDKMVRYDFRERYQSAAEVLTDLSQLIPSRPFPSAFPAHPSATSKPSETQIQLLTGTSDDALPSGSERRIDYTKLQNLLLDKAWREADLETQRLMLEACDHQGNVTLKGIAFLPGSRAANRLQVEEIRQFPCLDLHTLDYLWGNYSDGLFGFSAQKEIWQSVGGSSDASYEAWDRLAKGRSSRWRVNSPWHRFGNRVGWRVKEIWIDYEEFLFSLDAPRGHLPSWQGGGHISALFSRMEVCKPYVPQIDITLQP